MPVPNGVTQDDNDIHDSLSVDSGDTDIEMLPLVSESDTDTEHELTNGIVESDLDSQSDSAISTLNEDDKPLLAEKEEEEEEGRTFRVRVKRHFLWKRVWTKIRSVDPAALCRQFLLHQQHQCQECLCCGEVSAMRNRRRGCLEEVKECSWEKVCRWFWYRVKLMLDRRVFLSVLLYATCGFVGVMINEVRGGEGTTKNNHNNKYINHNNRYNNNSRQQVLHNNNHEDCDSQLAGGSTD